MSDPVDLGTKLDELAGKMIDAAQEKDVKLSERMKVFEIVSTHYVNVSKVKGKMNPNDVPGGKTMDDLRGQFSGGNGQAQGDSRDEQT